MRLQFHAQVLRSRTVNTLRDYWNNATAGSVGSGFRFRLLFAPGVSRGCPNGCHGTFYLSTAVWLVPFAIRALIKCPRCGKRLGHDAQFHPSEARENPVNRCNSSGVPTAAWASTNPSAVEPLR
jgi:hypothetical protein